MVSESQPAGRRPMGQERFEPLAREIYALKKQLNAVILAHNSTSGLAVAAIHDDGETQRIRGALDLVSIALLDHVIVGGREVFSLADHGLL